MSVVAARDVYGPELLGPLSDAGIPLVLRPLATPVLDLRLTPAIPSATAR
jgi:hypothetical protein